MSQNYYTTSPYRTKPRKFKGWGCLALIFVPIVLAVLIIVAIFFIYPSLTPNSLSGDLVDMTYVPEGAGKGKLWIVSDGSFYYVSSYESPGHKEWGTECFFCKLYIYIYDPVEERIINEVQIDYDQVPPKPKLFYINGSVWKVSRDHLDNEPAIHQYNAETGEILLNTEGFVKKFPELGAGINELTINEEPLRLDLTTFDGRDFMYSLKYDKLFANRKEMNKFFEKVDTATITVFVLEAKSGARKKLYKIIGPKNEIAEEHITKSKIVGLERVLRRQFIGGKDQKITAELITPDRAFIEGVVLCNNNDAAIILYQNRIGKKADRILTCIDSDGKERWTVLPDKLFPELKIDKEEDPFSDIFFMRDAISASIEGNIVIFKLTPVGIIGFDFQTGKKLWTIEF